ncbi:MAG TPA: adenylate kinase [Terriglobia bacterium]|nr:adenylate kinase [Terriglobia bacterium]
MKVQALIFLGAPGAGKGTQAREVSREFGVPHISTGDLLRDAVEKQTPLGKAAKAKMEAGELIPDEIVTAMVDMRIDEPDCKKGFLLDGFPRTLAQAESADKMFHAKNRGNPLVVDIHVEQGLLLKRLMGRRTCVKCGEIYNVYFTPPKKEGVCDKDGGELHHRADDNEDTIQQRLVAYENQTRPLVEYYEKKGLLHIVDGSKAPDEIARDLIKFLRRA